MQTRAKGRDDPFCVLIIGAGACGLLIGQGLKQAGIDCTIFERTDYNTYVDRRRDWSMGLHWGASYLKTCLSPTMLAKLKSAETDPLSEVTHQEETNLPICNGRTGEILVELSSISTRRVSRAKFREVLSLGKFSPEEGSVTATFAGGEEAIGDVLVGCDSSSSFVRSWLLGPEQARCEEMPVIAYNVTCRYTTDQALWLRSQIHPLMKCAPHPDQHAWYIIPILEVKNLSDPSTWIFQHFMNLWTDEPTPAISEERLKHLKTLTEGYAEPFRSAAQWIPNDTYVPYDRVKHWPNASLWNNCHGRVTLAGDAAHPMCPYRAQGLNNALTDAAHYVDCIKQVVKAPTTELQTLQQAINMYDKEVFERGSREIRVSAEQGYAAMHWDKYLESPRTRYEQGSVGQRTE